MRMAILLLVGILCCIATTAEAAFADFSDFAQSESFATGETFRSGGIEFRAADLLPTGTNVLINISNIGPGFSALSVGPGVEFVLPSGIEEISFNYGNGGGRLVAINGVVPPHSNDASLSFLDGQNIAGVSVSWTAVSQTVRPPFGVISEEGFLALRGPISSLALAGVEFSIDNVTVRVPEPSAAALLLIATIVTMTRRRRQAGRLREVK